MFGYSISGATLIKYYGFNPDVEIPSSVKTISQSAFISNKRIESVQIPSSVTEIAKCAFMWCENLSSVTLPKNLKVLQPMTFSSCSELKAISLPHGLEKIGEYAFEGSGLTKITIPDTVTAIGERAFDVKGRLDSVIIPCKATLAKDALGKNSATTICTIRGSDAERYAKQYGMRLIYLDEITQEIEDGKKTHPKPKKPTPPVSDFQISDGKLLRYTGSQQRVQIPNGVTVIGKRAFILNTFLKELWMPDTVTTVEDSAFSNCMNLQTVRFSPSLKTIEARAFRNTKLSCVVLPNSVERIGMYAFGFCNSLQNVTLPDKKIQILESAFAPCRNLQVIKIDAPSDFHIENGVLIRYTGSGEVAVIPDSVTAIGPRAFVGNRYIKEITITDRVSTLGDFAFSSCPSLCKVTLPSQLTCIPRAAFAHCTALTTILLPKSLKKIEESAFIGTGLTAITCPEGLKAIGAQAFLGCKNLQYAAIPAAIEEIGFNAFGNCPKLLVCAPKNTVAHHYANANKIPFAEKYTPTRIPKRPAPPNSKQLPGNISRTYYDHLTDPQKRLYAAAVPCLLQKLSGFPLPEADYTSEDFRSVCHAILRDYPQLYWVKGSFEIRQGNLQNAYKYSLEEIKRREDAVERVVAPVVARICRYADEYQKAKYAFLWLIDHVEYDHEGLEKEEKGICSPDLDDMRSIYGAFCKRKVVCAGYAVALQYLLQRLGLESNYCVGIPIRPQDESRHAWTMVKINGSYYHIDATWNDSASTEGIYPFFCVTDSEMLTIWDCIEDYDILPAANDIASNYYVKEGLYMESWDKEVFMSRVEQYMQEKKPRSLHFRIPNVEYNALSSVICSTEFNAMMKKYGIIYPSLNCSRFGVFIVK